MKTTIHLRALRFISLAALTAALASAQTQHTSRPAQATQLLPEIASGAVTLDGDFEVGPLPGGIQTGVTDPNWIFSQGAGLAETSHPLVQGFGPASGSIVAGAVGNQFVIAVNDLSAGSYRLQYQGAGTLNAVAQVAFFNSVWTTVDDVLLTSSFEEYTSRPFRIDAAPGTTQQVLIAWFNPNPGTIIAFDDLRLERLHEWNDGASWLPVGVGVPNADDDVSIPSGSAISLVGNAAAARIEVAGELLVPDVAGGIEADLISVISPAVATPAELVAARFEVGRERVPFTETFDVLLTNATVPPTGMHEREDRAILVGNGAELDLHGRTTTTWTKLIQTANSGATEFLVEDAQLWLPGDEVVLAGSSKEQAEGEGGTATSCDTTLFFTHQHERVRIESATIDSATGGYLVKIDQSVSPPLSNLHVGDAPIDRTITYEATPGDGTVNELTETLVLDQRAEVGNLSRSIVIKSETASFESPCGTDGSPFAGSGGHVMILGVGHGHGHGSPGSDVRAGFARVSSVEFRGLGRTGILGRYPFHWHMVRDEGSGQYLRDCSVVDSFHRAITIHGTDNTVVDGNVAVDTLGHAVFLEDGSEMDNQITRNLVVGTRKVGCLEEGILETDFAPSSFQSRAPGSFWITNPSNFIEDNVASDTVGTGFWLSFGFEVFGDSAALPIGSPPDPGQEHNAEVAPWMLPLGSFARNKAHGCNAGLDYNDGMQADPTVGPKGHPSTQTLVGNLGWEAPQPDGSTFLDEFTVYGCETGIYAGIGRGQVTHRNLVSADNEKNLFLASFDLVLRSWILANGPTDVIPDGCDSPVEAMRLYDGASTTIDTVFDNFDSAGARFFGVNPAANRNVNHRLKRCSHFGYDFVTDTATPLAPWAEFSEFDCLLACNQAAQCTTGTPESCECCDLLAFDIPGTITNTIAQLRRPDSWGVVVHDIDGGIFGPGGTRLVSDAPWMLFGDETVAPASSFGSMRETNRRYGLLKVYLPKITLDNGTPSGPGAAQFPLVSCRFSRVSNFTATESYSSGPRSLVLPACPAAFPWGPPVDALPFHQIPFVAEAGVRTVVNFGTVGGLAPSGAACSQNVADIRLRVGDIDAGDRFVVQIDNLDELNGAPVTGMTVTFNGLSTTPAASFATVADAVAFVEAANDREAAWVPSADSLVIGVVKETEVLSSQEIVVVDKTDIVTVDFD